MGAVGEADDLAQEAFLRFHRAVASGERIESPKTYLVTVVTRLAVDHLRSARRRREQPDENLDNQTINDLLVPAMKEAKRRRQVIVVTHNPNVAVVADADQLVAAEYADGTFSYRTGAIESPRINATAVDVLEGTWPAFKNRQMKYQSPG